MSLSYSNFTNLKPANSFTKIPNHKRLPIFCLYIFNGPGGQIIKPHRRGSIAKSNIINFENCKRAKSVGRLREKTTLSKRNGLDRKGTVSPTPQLSKADNTFLRGNQLSFLSATCPHHPQELPPTRTCTRGLPQSLQTLNY